MLLLDVVVVGWLKNSNLYLSLTSSIATSQRRNVAATFPSCAKIIFSKKIEQDCPKMPPLMLRRKRNESFFCKNTFLTNFCTKLLNLLWSFENEQSNRFLIGERAFSVTRRLDFLFIFRPYTTIKCCPIASNLHNVGWFKILQNTQ